MSESQHKADPKICWNCGALGTYLVSSKMHCPGCDVTWMPLSNPMAGPAEVWWNGKLVECIDFTKPGALSCPA